MKLRVIILSQSSVMEYRNPHLAVLAAAKDGFTDCCSEGFAGPKAVQDMKDALSGTFAEQRCRDIAPLVQFTCTFQKIQVINSVFLYRFTFHILRRAVHRLWRKTGQGLRPPVHTGLYKFEACRIVHSSCRTSGRKSPFAFP